MERSQPVAARETRRAAVRLAVALAMLTAVATGVAPARTSAQAGGVDRTAEARTLFEEGLRFVEAQQWQEAADRFGSVLAIRASATVSYNYASALEHLGRIVEATRVLRGVVADPSASREVVEAARKLLAAQEPRIGQLTVRLRGDTSDVLVTVDDQTLPEGSIGIPVPVDPGEHVIRATRNGLPLARRKVEVTEGSTSINVEIDVVPLPSAVAAEASPPADQAAQPLSLDTDSGDGGGSTWIWIAGGSVLAVGAMVLVGLIVANPSDPDPVHGNTDPPVLHGRVGASTP